MKIVRKNKTTLAANHNLENEINVILKWNILVFIDILYRKII